MTIRSGIGGGKLVKENAAAFKQLQKNLDIIKDRVLEYSLQLTEKAFQQSFNDIEESVTHIVLQNDSKDKIKEEKLHPYLETQIEKNAVGCIIRTKNELENAILLASSHGTAFNIPQEILEFFGVEEEKTKTSGDEETNFSSWYFEPTLIHIKFPIIVQQTFKDLIHG